MTQFILWTRFQSEIRDILRAMDKNRLHAARGSKVTVYDDSQAVLKAIVTYITNSKLDSK